MLALILSQIAVPHGMSKPDNWWAVVINDPAFIRCSHCVQNLKRTVWTSFDGQIERLTFSYRKRALYIWTKSNVVLDTLSLKRILEKEGVKAYEILH
ncbi:MAG: hypothetical protein GXO29_02215 [Thermotogae bacterium]|nr:hypothetical protein [Thermotogota bacterium]